MHDKTADADIDGNYAWFRLGITVLPLEMVPPGLMAVGGEAGPDVASLPPLYDTEIALIEAPGLSDTAHLLAQHIIAALERGA